MPRKEKQQPGISQTASLIAGLKPLQLSEWRVGKELEVADARASLVFAGLNDSTPVGIKLRYAGTVGRTAPDGTRKAVIVFKTEEGEVLYPTGRTPQDASSLKSLDIPMTVDPDLATAADSLLKGARLWTLTRMRYAADGSEAEGLQYVPVTITGVRTGTPLFPLAVVFDDHSGQARSLLISVRGQSGIGAETRRFEKLFTATNPRLRYPRIDDEVWDAICRGHLLKGMTKEECRLAIGNPEDADAGHTWDTSIDIWKYGDGTFLRFEDGRLADFRR